MKKTSFPKSKIQVALLENIHSSASELFEKEGFQVKNIKDSLSEKALIEELKDVHVLGIRSKTQVRADYFKKSERLLAVGCFCIGTNQVDLRSAKLAGVPVFNSPYSNTRSVAELIIAEIIMLTRRAAERSMFMHQGKWEKSHKSCYEVREKVLGIIGYGHIGSQVGILAEAFGMRVIYFDIASKMPIGNSHSVSTLDELLKQSDFVTLHVPETDQTRNMIGTSEIKKMKKGACLLNASRGTVVDLRALRKSLDEGHLGGAALDVFPEEPESNESEFKNLLQGARNVILTPHIGGATEEAQKNIGREVAESLIRFVNEGRTSLSVNFPQLDAPVNPGSHRILNVHKNVPGVIANVTKLISDIGANIESQYLSTDPDIGYLIIDINQDLSDKVRDQISDASASIKTRLLY